MNSPVTLQLALPFLAFLVTAMFGGFYALVIFFVKRELARAEDTIKELRTLLTETRAAATLAQREVTLLVDQKFSSAQSQTSSAKTELERQVKDLETRLNVLDRGSMTDINAVEDKFRSLIEKDRSGIDATLRELRALITTNREDHLKFVAEAGATFLSRNEFIRQSTQLDARVAQTNRGLKTIETSLDQVLENYLAATKR